MENLTEEIMENIQENYVSKARYQILEIIKNDLKEQNKDLKEQIDRMKKFVAKAGYVKEENAKLRECVEKCLYWTSMRDPEINTHKQACDSVEEISAECLKDL